MPSATLDECRKDRAKEDFSEWTPLNGTTFDVKEWTGRIVRDTMKEKCAVKWAVSIREQHEPTRQALRAFRWRQRSRCQNLAARMFYQEANKWKDDTMHWSSVTKMIAHPSYLRIIALANKFKEGEIERLILREMEAEPDHWFDALAAITGENPVGEHDDFDASVDAWLNWGRQKGFIN